MLGVYNCIIIGAGAAGLMAALTAAKASKKVLLIDHNKTAGRKILVSGGGKCNITNTCIKPSHYFTNNSLFCKPALQGYTTQHCLDWLSNASIEIEERAHGRLFCKNSARQVVDYLLHQLDILGVRLLLDTKVEDIKFNQNVEVFTSNGVFTAKSVLLATGGLAWPQVGATDFAWRIAKSVGHKIIPAQPALTGFVLEQNHPFLLLQGINLLVESWIDAKHKTCEPMVFTYKGLSGPGMLQTSCYWKKEAKLFLNFLPDKSIVELMHMSSNGKLNLKTLLTYHIAQRLVETLFPANILNEKVARLSKNNRKEIEQTIHAYCITPTGLEGFKKAETTIGGVDTVDVNPKTMESKLQNGLFMAGELLDVAGKLGGYNIHWAFASGIAAAKAM